MTIFSATVVSPSQISQHNGSLKVGEQIIAAHDLLPKIRRYGLMPALVKEVVVDQALADITLSEEDSTTAIEHFIQGHQLNDEEQRQAFLQQRGLVEADLESIALRDLKLRKFKDETWGNKIESYFLQRKNRLDRVLYSLIRTKEAGLAQEIYFRIQDDGQPFADLARQYSEGQEAQTGGLIGPVELSVPHPALARMLSISQPGQLWPPTRVGEWFVVVRLEKFLPAKLDDGTRQRMLDELYNSWLTDQVKAALNGQPVDNSQPANESTTEEAPPNGHEPSEA
jgi:parvulin-like peptidyl-prolyl isomerase